MTLSRRAEITAIQTNSGNLVRTLTPVYVMPFFVIFTKLDLEMFFVGDCVIG